MGDAAMMSAQENQLITQIGPGTPCGALMRRYWQPAALVEELTGPRPVKAVRLLGEDLVLFRDEAGRYGLLRRDCPHRGADLAFGRREDGGLRCSFHGWLFDVTGQCRDTPAEPEGSPLCKNIRQPAYPVVERSGVLWTYMGPGGLDAAPGFPAFDCFVAPDTHTFAFKGLWECNWLQALEVGIDPAHASYLHRFFEDEDRSQAYGKQFRDASMDSDIPMTQVMREHGRPAIEVVETEWGLKILTTRDLGNGKTHVRVTNQVFPHAITIPLSQEMMLTQWHVPVDDENCYWYTVFTSFGQPIDKAAMRAQRLQVYELPDYRSKKNRTNDYGFDPHEQAHKTYTGMGEDINVHDQWAVESLGRIQDRTREHLGHSDKAISAYRRLLKRSIEQVKRGESPVLAVGAEEAARLRGPLTIDGIAATAALATYPVDADRRRREGAAWASMAAE
jgi:phenylpropionate dioxygenase-like ring-hydroxylating dioxygenase large terminal subunit